MMDFKKKKHKENKWQWFKGIVYEMRLLNSRLRQEQDGNNQLMMSISLMDINSNDWIDMNPHSIDLRSKKTFVLFNGRYTWIDVLHLLLYEQVKPLW